MSRFFKSAAFPILIVIVLAFFASKLIQSGNAAEKTSYPEAIQQVDIPIIMGVTLVSALAIVIGNLLADLVAPMIDPRIKAR